MIVEYLKRKGRNFLNIYKPEELGWKDIFPEVKYISISGCISGEKWDYTTNLAHAHSNVICLGNRRYLYNSKKEPGDFVWHEYAHILAKDVESPHNLDWTMVLVKLNKDYIMFPYLPHTTWYNDGNTGTIRKASNLNG